MGLCIFFYGTSWHASLVFSTTAGMIIFLLHVEVSMMMVGLKTEYNQHEIATKKHYFIDKSFFFN
jgi:hypothetical protein